MAMENARKFDEFKHEMSMLMGAMQRTLRASHSAPLITGSQYNEDEILAGLLPDPKGFYVDVGAGHPIDCSNSFQFYKRGWRGLLVECLPSNWHALLRQRPGDHLCPLAAFDTPGFARMRVAQSVSSIRPDWDVTESGDLIVECATLKSILEPYPQIRDGCSLLSIDVEGAEVNVIRGIDFDTFRPKVIVVEAFRYHPDEASRVAWHAKHQVGDDLSSEWEGLLRDRGYRLHAKNGLNKVYVAH